MPYTEAQVEQLHRRVVELVGRVTELEQVLFKLLLHHPKWWRAMQELECLHLSGRIISEVASDDDRGDIEAWYGRHK